MMWNQPARLCSNMLINDSKNISLWMDGNCNKLIIKIIEQIKNEFSQIYFYKLI